jgi:hypothetical protein
VLGLVVLIVAGQAAVIGWVVLAAVVVLATDSKNLARHHA